jgi:hypothetical protein
MLWCPVVDVCVCAICLLTVSWCRSHSTGSSACESAYDQLTLPHVLRSRPPERVVALRPKDRPQGALDSAPCRAPGSEAAPRHGTALRSGSRSACGTTLGTVGRSASRNYLLPSGSHRDRYFLTSIDRIAYDTVVRLHRTARVGRTLFRVVPWKGNVGLRGNGLAY